MGALQFQVRLRPAAQTERGVFAGHRAGACVHDLSSEQVQRAASAGTADVDRGVAPLPVQDPWDVAERRTTDRAETWAADLVAGGGVQVVEVGGIEGDELTVLHVKRAEILRCVDEQGRARSV